MLQFYHDIDNFKQRTVALEVPSKNTLMDMLKICQRLIKLKVGETKVNPKDIYNKKTGRELSSQRLIEILFELYKITFHEDHMKFYLKTTEDNQLVLKVFYHKDKIHFIKA